MSNFFFKKINKKLVIVLFFTLLNSCNHKNISKENNYTIIINIEGINIPTKLFLKEIEFNFTKVIDSATMYNNSATFTGNINLPEVYGIYIENNDKGIFPIIEKGTIHIEYEIDNPNNSKIYGTESNNLLNKYLNDSKKITSKINDLFIEIQKARTENNLQKLKELNQRIKLIINENDSYSINFIKNNSNSIVASIVLFKLINNKTNISNDTLVKLYSNLDANVKKNQFSEKISVILNIE